MAYTRSQTFQPGTFLRSCDICGIRYRANELRKGEDGFWRCLSYCIETPAITRDRISAQSQRRKEAPAPPHGIPYDRSHTYAEEAQIFNLLCETPVRDTLWTGGVRLGVPPFEFMDATNGGLGATTQPLQYAQYGTTTDNYSFNAAAETMRYLYNVITENKRPASWITAARAKLKQLADWLITKQSGIGTNLVDGAIINYQYGSWITRGLFSAAPFSNSGAILIEDVAGCGLGMLYAYRVFGSGQYLASAKAAATAIRNNQWSSYGNGGTSNYFGYLSRAWFVTDGFPNDYGSDRLAFPSQLIALEFLNELLTTAGNGTYGDTTDANALFSGVASASLVSIIADLRAFWLSGTYDSVVGSSVVGFSATTPREVFADIGPYQIGSGTGSWEYQDGASASGTKITAANYAKALRSLYAFEGYSTQVASIYEWLMQFASNASFIGAAGTLPSDYVIATTNNSANPPTPPVGQGNTIAASYDPSKALSTLLSVRTAQLASTAQNATNVYDWSTAGYLAAIHSSKAAAAFRRSKMAVVLGRYRLPPTFERNVTPITDTAMLRGQSGLSYQLSGATAVYQDYWFGLPPVTVTQKYWNTVSAAVIGGMFRYQPQSFTGAPAPGAPYSQAAPGVQA